MKTYNINLSELIDSAKVDSISGRSLGEGFAEKHLVLTRLKEGYKFVLIIDSQQIKAINDSFIKGFFSKVFEYLKSAEKVKESFTLDANDYFIRLFDKNYKILDAIYNV